MKGLIFYFRECFFQLDKGLYAEEEAHLSAVRLIVSVPDKDTTKKSLRLN